MPMNEVILHIPEGDKLPDNAQWENRFPIHSSSSDRVYIVAQHKSKRHWACSCPGWRSRRVCQHLSTLRLPNYERPHEVIVK
jgi:hypothetical protein